MFSIGDFAYDLVRNEKVDILEKNEIWGYISYRVYNPISKEIYNLSSEQIVKDMAELNYNENYVRYIVSLGKIKMRSPVGYIHF